MEPTLEPSGIPAFAVPLVDLRPTQVTLSLNEVEEKRREWRGHGGHDAPKFLVRHMIPVLRGPKDRFYGIDHHHLTRALLVEGVESVLVDVVADLEALAKREFWTDAKADDHTRDWPAHFSEPAASPRTPHGVVSPNVPRLAPPLLASGLEAAASFGLGKQGTAARREGRQPVLRGR